MAAAHRRDRIPALDGLRGIAVLLVVAAHVPSRALPEGQAGHLFGELFDAGGYLGVDIFFVMSGFLITRILLVGMEMGAPLRFFLARRALRIFPIYFLTLAGFALFAYDPVLPWAAAYLTNYYLAFHTTTLPITHLWSLAVEEHFYLLWPLVVSRLGLGAARRVVFGVVLPGAIVSSVLLLALEMPGAGHLIYKGTQSRIFSLGLGAAVALYEGRVRARPWSQRIWGLLLGLGAPVLVGASIFALRFGSGQLGFVLAYASISLLLLLAVLAASDRGEPLARALSRGPLPAVGKVSYGLYLYHPIVFAGLDRILTGSLSPSWTSFGVAAALGFGASYLVAAASYRWVETPFLLQKARFEPAPAHESPRAMDPSRRSNYV
jgi:peptidoglycan/LPS O-acetylase OafA/YrhL